MKHKTMTLILIFMIIGSVLISGCIDKENAATGITSQSGIASHPQSSDRRDY